MKIIEKISEKNKNLNQAKPVTIAFLGDSITQGCFECYYDEKGSLQTVFDTNSSYSTRVKEISLRRLQHMGLRQRPVRPGSRRFSAHD